MENIAYDKATTTFNNIVELSKMQYNCCIEIPLKFTKMPVLSEPY